MFYKTNYSVPSYKFYAFPKIIHQKWKCFRRYIFMPHLLRGSSSPVVSNHWGYIAVSYFPNSYSHPNIGNWLTFKKNPLSPTWPFFSISPNKMWCWKNTLLAGKDNFSDTTAKTARMKMIATTPTWRSTRTSSVSSEEDYDKNIAKGTTDPRVEFILPK